MTVCPQCGKSLPEDEAFCASCGYAASKVEPPTTDDATNPYAVGTQLPDSPMPSDVEPRDVPCNVFEAFSLCFKDGGVKGRSSRSEFWYWILFVFLTVVCPIVVFVMLETPPNGTDALSALIFPAALWGIICAGPTFTVSVRRFHDVNLAAIPAYIILLGIVLTVPICLLVRFSIASDFGKTLVLEVFPLVAGICLLAILFVALIPGTKRANKYGPPPGKREIATDDNAEDKTQDVEVSQ